MRPKKSLGQNFLHSTAVRSRIIAAAAFKSAEGSLPYTVLEIGPGKGFLTEALLSATEPAGRVVAIEKDDQLYEFLREKFAREIKDKRLELIHGDITEGALPDLGKYKVVANIPYYITGEIIRLFLENPPGNQQPEEMVLMTQKEVAERITARDGRESLLSISVKAFGDPEYVQTVKAGSFFPIPKVDSAILAIRNINRKRLDHIPSDRFFSWLHRGFAHKRKLLRSNLDCSTEILGECNIEEKARAENLNLNQWLCLIKTLELGANGK